MTAFTVAPADTQPEHYTADPVTAATAFLTLTVDAGSAYYKLTTGIDCAWDDFANRKAPLHVVQFFYLWKARAAEGFDLDELNATEKYASVALLSRIDAALLADDGFDTATTPRNEEELMTRLESWPVENAEATVVSAADLASYEVRPGPVMGQAGVFEQFISVGMLAPPDSNAPFRWWSKLMHLAKGTGRMIDRNEAADTVNPAYRDMVVGLFYLRLPLSVSNKFQVLPGVTELMTALDNAPKNAMSARWTSVMAAAKDALFAKGLASSDKEQRKKSIVSRLDMVIAELPALTKLLSRVTGPNKEGAVDLLFKLFPTCGDSSNLTSYPLMQFKLAELELLRPLGSNEDPIRYITVIAELDGKAKQRGGGSSSYSLAGSAAAEDSADHGGFGGTGGAGATTWDENKQAILGSNEVSELIAVLEGLDETNHVKVIEEVLKAKIPMCSGLLSGHHKRATGLRVSLQKIFNSRFFVRHHWHNVMVANVGVDANGVACSELAEGHERYEVTEKFERMVGSWKFDVTVVLEEVSVLYDALGRGGASQAGQLEAWMNEGKVELAAQMLQRVYTGMGGEGTPFSHWVSLTRDTVCFFSQMFSAADIAEKLSQALEADVKRYTTMLQAAITIPEKTFPKFELSRSAFEEIQTAFDNDAKAKRTDAKQFEVMGVLKGIEPDALRALLAKGKRKAISQDPDEGHAAEATPQCTRAKLLSLGLRLFGKDQQVFVSGKHLVRAALDNSSYVAYEKDGLTKKWRELTKQGMSITPCWDVLTSDLGTSTARSKVAPEGTNQAAYHEPANWISARRAFRSSDFRLPMRN